MESSSHRSVAAKLDESASTISINTKTTSSKKSDISFSQRYVESVSVRSDLNSLDHCYSRNWNCQSEQSHAENARWVAWSDNTRKELLPPTRLASIGSLFTFKYMYVKAGLTKNTCYCYFIEMWRRRRC